MNEHPDPAAVFACALSLHNACIKQADADPALDLSDAYQGMDQFMRELMRIADLFETWACRHVSFDHLDEVWPYLLEGRFGDACLDVMQAEALGEYDDDDCLRVAFHLRLPLRVDGVLPIPVCVEASNPIAGAATQRLRIQTVRRRLLDDGSMSPFTENDDPFDDDFEQPVFRVYAEGAGGLSEVITDMRSYDAAREMLVKLLPGIALPEEVVAFSGSGRSSAR